MHTFVVCVLFVYNGSGFVFQRRVDVKAFHSYGSYYKLSAIMNVTSDRTKVEFLYFGSHYLVKVFAMHDTALNFASFVIYKSSASLS